MSKKIKDENGRIYIQKKPFYKRWWFILLIIVILIGAFAGGNNDSSENTTNSNQTESNSSTSEVKNESKESSDQKKTYSIGQVVTVGDVEYTITGIQQAQTVGDEFLGDNAQGIYQILDVTIKNNGKKALSVSSDFFKLYNGETEYSSDSEASLYASDNQGFFLEEINPGNTLTGRVAFDIPQDIAVNSLQVQVQTGVFGTETERISLAQ